MSGCAEGPCEYGTCGGAPEWCGGCCGCLGGCIVAWEEELIRQHRKVSDRGLVRRMLETGS